MSQENRFGEYISKLRTSKGISQEQLCDGLCDLSLLSRFERGEREADKLLQNRFLTRLGVVPEHYENFLYYKDYCRWEKRQGIIHNILDEKVEEAKRQLEEYHREYDMTFSLEQQFYLAMKAQIRQYEGADKEELANLFGRALTLTVPEIDTRSFRNRVLSLEELNLLLEYRFCRPQGISLQFYEMLLEYIDKNGQTILAMAKIYPKTVYYYYLSWKNSGAFTMDKAVRMMELCDRAIEILRNANRMFYMWELFCVKEELTSKLPEGLYLPEAYAASVEECRSWRKTLEGLYEEYKVSIAMYEFCYLYVESENYCIDDVIRIRRKMLGLSQEKLSKGICDSRTIGRLERHIRKPQKEIVQQLFDRLNLSTELCRTELVTDSQEAIEKIEEVRKQINNKNYSNVVELLEKVKGLVSLENPSNIQSISRIEYIYNYNLGRYSKEEHIIKLKEVLGYTIPYEKVLASKEKYLTNVEIGCIQNIVANGKWIYDEVHECVDVLISYYNNLSFPAYYTRMYEFVMLTVACKLGDKREHDYSNQIMKNILKMSLVSRRIKAIDSLIYEILWNDKQMEGGENGRELKNEELNRCIELCDLSFRTRNRDFYFQKKKINAAKGKGGALSLAEES